MTLINSSLDSAENIELLVRTDAEEASVFDMQCAETRVRSARSSPPYSRLALPAIPPWQVRLVVM